MRPRFASGALALMLTLGCAAGPSPQGATQEPATQERASPPDLAELRQLLAGVSQHTFTAEEQARGCPSGETVQQYLATLDQNTQPDPSEPDRILERSGGCDVSPADALWPEPDPALWLCTVKAHTVDAAGESPWTYELRVRVRRADRTLDTSFIACPGAA